MSYIKHYKLINLNSVGTVLNVNTGLTYPMLANGEPDLSDMVAVHVTDVDEEWVNSLSSADSVIFTEACLSHLYEIDDEEALPSYAFSD